MEKIMNKAKILLIFVVAVLSGCVDKSGGNTAATNSSYYQTAPATRESDVAVTVTPQTAAKSTTNSSIGGGGGGGGKTAEPSIPVAQQVSLQQAETVQNQPVVTERKIIRNADLQLETDAPEQAQQKITAIAESKGGFVVESQQSNSDARAGTKRDTVTMNIRVPSEKFGETLEEIRKTANRTIVETVKSDDVTEEFIDIEAQLKAKKALEAQFLEIMKRANTVEDALEVQRELADVRGEIEKIEGRKRFLENQAALSTIKIRLQTPTTLTANSDGFGYRLKESFGNGFDAALNFILGLVSFVIAILPFLIFIVLPIYLIVRYILKKRRKQATASEIAKDELKDE